jgi:hypothetical protein
LRKASSIISVLAFLGIVIAGGHGAGPVGGYLWAMISGGPVGSGPFTAYYLAILIPTILLLSSCLVPKPGAARALQAAGSTLLLAWWCWLLSKSEYPSITLSTGTLFAGLTVYALLESWYFERRPTIISPALRGAIALLVLELTATIAGELFQLHFSRSVEHGSGAGVWHPTLTQRLIQLLLLGLLVAFVLGALRRKSWAPWVGVSRAAYLLGVGIWSLVYQLAAMEGSMSSSLLFSQSPRLLCLLAAVVVLGREIWRSRNRRAATAVSQ